MRRGLTLLLAMVILFAITACRNEEEKAELYCWSCGKGVSNKAYFCENCGVAVRDNLGNNEEKATDSNDSDDQLFGSVEKEIEFATNLFYQKKSTVLTNYPDATEERSSVVIDGTFAGMNGKYDICTSDDKVYQVLFIRDEGVIVSDEVIDKICEYIGDYIEYDDEWDMYKWETSQLELSLYVDERVYFEPTYEDYSDDDNISTNQGNNGENETLTDSEIEDLAVQTLYKQLLAYENKYHNIDAASCRYKINKIERDDGSVEVYGVVWYYDKYGSITKFGSSYQGEFTIHMTERGSLPWCEID